MTFDKMTMEYDDLDIEELSDDLSSACRPPDDMDGYCYMDKVAISICEDILHCFQVLGAQTIKDIMDIFEKLEGESE